MWTVQDRDYAFRSQLKTSPPLGFGRVRDSRPVLLNGCPLRLFESRTALQKHNRSLLSQ